MMLRAFILIAAFVTLALAKVTVAVSVAPQSWIVKQIVRDADVEVIVMSPPNVSAHTFEPKPAQMAALSKADIYLACGVEFEQVWLDRFKSNAPKMKVYNTDQGFQKLTVGGGADTHIWLSAAAMRAQIQTTMRALGETDPNNMGRYQINGMKLFQVIDRVKAQFMSLVAPYNGRAFMTYHPALGYIANDYRLRQLSIEFEGREPKPAELAALIETAKKENIKTIFVTEESGTKTAEAVAKAIGGNVEKIDVMSDDWEAMMISLATTLINSFN